MATESVELQCFRCEAKLDSQLLLHHHVLERHSEECWLCGARFGNEVELRDHESFLHTAEHEGECSICHLRLPNAIELATHIADIHKKNAFVCPLCSEEFPEIFLVRRHITREHLTELIQKSTPTSPDTTGHVSTSDEGSAKPVTGKVSLGEILTKEPVKKRPAILKSRKSPPLSPPTSPLHLGYPAQFELGSVEKVAATNQGAVTSGQKTAASTSEGDGSKKVQVEKPSRSQPLKRSHQKKPSAAGAAEKPAPAKSERSHKKKPTVAGAGEKAAPAKPKRSHKKKPVGATAAPKSQSTEDGNSGTGKSSKSRSGERPVVVEQMESDSDVIDIEASPGRKSPDTNEESPHKSKNASSHHIFGNSDDSVSDLPKIATRKLRRRSSSSKPPGRIVHTGPFRFSSDELAHFSEIIRSDPIGPTASQSASFSQTDLSYGGIAVKHGGGKVPLVQFRQMKEVKTAAGAVAQKVAPAAGIARIPRIRKKMVVSGAGTDHRRKSQKKRVASAPLISKKGAAKSKKAPPEPQAEAGEGTVATPGLVFGLDEDQLSYKRMEHDMAPSPTSYGPGRSYGSDFLPNREGMTQGIETLEPGEIPSNPETATKRVSPSKKVVIVHVFPKRSGPPATKPPILIPTSTGSVNLQVRPASPNFADVGLSLADKIRSIANSNVDYSSNAEETMNAEEVTELVARISGTGKTGKTTEPTPTPGVRGGSGGQYSLEAPAPGSQEFPSPSPEVSVGDTGEPSTSIPLENPTASNTEHRGAHPDVAGSSPARSKAFPSQSSKSTLPKKLVAVVSPRPRKATGWRTAGMKEIDFSSNLTANQISAPDPPSPPRDMIRRVVRQFDMKPKKRGRGRPRKDSQKPVIPKKPDSTRSPKTTEMSVGKRKTTTVISDELPRKVTKARSAGYFEVAARRSRQRSESSINVKSPKRSLGTAGSPKSLKTPPRASGPPTPKSKKTPSRSLAASPVRASPRSSVVSSKQDVATVIPKSPETSPRPKSSSRSHDATSSSDSRQSLQLGKDPGPPAAIPGRAVPPKSDIDGNSESPWLNSVLETELGMKNSGGSPGRGKVPGISKTRSPAHRATATPTRWYSKDNVLSPIIERIVARNLPTVCIVDPNIDPSSEPPVKRGRGRPRKSPASNVRSQKPAIDVEPRKPSDFGPRKPSNVDLPIIAARKGGGRRLHRSKLSQLSTGKSSAEMVRKLDIPDGKPENLSEVMRKLLEETKSVGIGAVTVPKTTSRGRSQFRNIVDFEEYLNDVIPVRNYAFSRTLSPWRVSGLKSKTGLPSVSEATAEPSPTKGRVGQKSKTGLPSVSEATEEPLPKGRAGQKAKTGLPAISEATAEPFPKGRGRPRKIATTASSAPDIKDDVGQGPSTTQKRGRGRPPNVSLKIPIASSGVSSAVLNTGSLVPNPRVPPSRNTRTGDGTGKGSTDDDTEPEMFPAPRPSPPAAKRRRSERGDLSDLLLLLDVEDIFLKPADLSPVIHLKRFEVPMNSKTPPSTGISPKASKSSLKRSTSDGDKPAGSIPQASSHPTPTSKAKALPSPPSKTTASKPNNERSVKKLRKADSRATRTSNTSRAKDAHSVRTGFKMRPKAAIRLAREDQIAR